MKILIVEDDKLTIETLKEELKDDYIIESACTEEEGIYLIENYSYDIIILDLALPDGNGITICKNIRKANIKTPVLILTGKDNIDDKVTALDFGADDYLVKPFNFAELRARIRALLRREDENYKSTCFSIGDLTIDTAKRKVERKNKKINLRRKEFSILEYLIRNQGKVLTREAIMDHLWDISSESMSNTVDVHIKYLRDKIDKPYEKKYIKTVYGLGYKFEV